jgi:hypothetical protein
LRADGVVAQRVARSLQYAASERYRVASWVARATLLSWMRVTALVVPLVLGCTTTLLPPANCERHDLRGQLDIYLGNTARSFSVRTFGECATARCAEPLDGESACGRWTSQLLRAPGQCTIEVVTTSGTVTKVHVIGRRSVCISDTDTLGAAYRFEYEVFTTLGANHEYPARDGAAALAGLTRPANTSSALEPMVSDTL